MNPKDFIEKRIVLQNCIQSHANGKTCIIVDADRDEQGDIRLYTDLPSPENSKQFLLVRVENVAYYKEFSHCSLQYRKPNGDTVMMPFIADLPNDMVLVGGFDVYKKIVPVLS